MNSNKLWPYNIEQGDMLTSIPEWNKTHTTHKLPVPVMVERVKYDRSQSGVQFHVMTKAGIVRNLDAAWFIQPDNYGCPTNGVASHA